MGRLNYGSFLSSAWLLFVHFVWT